MSVLATHNQPNHSTHYQTDDRAYSNSKPETNKAQSLGVQHTCDRGLHVHDLAQTVHFRQLAFGVVVADQG